MIRKGTTPTHIFNTNVDLTAAVVLYITYKQGGRVVIEKNIDDCEVTTETITVKLTQEETLKLNDTQAVEMQIRARFSDGTAVASNIMTAEAGRILKGGEI